VDPSLFTPFPPGPNPDSTAWQEMTFKCINCRRDIFKLSDLRRIQDAESNHRHYVVIDPTIKERTQKDEDIKNKNKEFGEFIKTGDLLCLCDEDLGLTADYSVHGEVNVVKIRSFLVIDAAGVTNTYKQWKDFTFPIQDLSPHDDLY
jgi:hypothetical protein